LPGLGDGRWHCRTAGSGVGDGGRIPRLEECYLIALALLGSGVAKQIPQHDRATPALSRPIFALQIHHQVLYFNNETDRSDAQTVAPLSRIRVANGLYREMESFREWTAGDVTVSLEKGEGARSVAMFVRPK
jgi:hypothetical protein